MKPNIIFILADDMGYGDFSAFNKGLSSTPVLDNLMEEGATFTQHYSASAVLYKWFIADTTPPGAKFERIERVAKMAREFTF